MEEGQRFLVVERPCFDHEPRQEIDRPVGLDKEGGQSLAPIAPTGRPVPLHQHLLGPGQPVGGRHPKKGEMEAAFIMIAPAVEPGLPLAVDQPGRRVGEAALGIADRFDPFGVEEQGPARSEALEDIIDPRRGRHQLGLRRAFKVRAAEPEGPLEAPVLVEHHPRRDQRCPGEMVGKPVGAISIFADIQHE